MNPPNNNNNKNNDKNNDDNDKNNPYNDVSDNEIKKNIFLVWGDLNENPNKSLKNIWGETNDDIENNKPSDSDNNFDKTQLLDDLIKKLTDDIIEKSIFSYNKKKKKSFEEIKKKYLPADYLDTYSSINIFEKNLKDIDTLLYNIDEKIKEINEIKKKYNTNSYYNKYRNPLSRSSSNQLIVSNQVKNPFLFNYNTKKNNSLFNNNRFNINKKTYIPNNHKFDYKQQQVAVRYNPLFKRTKINIQVEINTIDDIIDVINKYPLKFDVEYNINMTALHNIKSYLINLNDMIGMNQLKNSIVDQILYFIQNFHINKKSKNTDFLHTVIYGPPGTGKTEIAKIIGNIYSKIGILNKNTFKKVTRSDLVAGYLGQTALKTKEVIEQSLGGVLFIDEAYALGNPEKKDSFAKECLDTLCEALSDYKENLMVIIAGYKDELKKCFFEYNQGLDSRFTWRFHTDDYNFKELFLIFKKKVYDIAWTLNNKVKNSWFENKMEYFKYYGRDMETLLAKVKIAHSRRVFCLDERYKRNINVADMNKGFDLFISNDEVKSRKEDTNDLYKLMYS